MYTVVIALIFMSSVSAELPLNMAGLSGKMKQEHPEPCCAPSAYTMDAYSITTYVVDGKLFEEHVASKFAYDAIEKKTASKLHIGFTNGTEESIIIIDIYEKEESYTIFQFGEDETCYKDKLTERFSYACIPDSAEYVGSATLGDRALDVHVWSVDEETPFGDTHSVAIYQDDECVPISFQFRRRDSVTDEPLDITTVSVSDFKLGICDKEEIFHVPDICHESTLSKPAVPEQLMKLHALTRRSGLYFGGK